MIPSGPPASLGDALSEAARRLRLAGVEQPRLDARLLLAHVLGAAPEALLAYPERPLGAEEATAFRALVARREGREPVARILGHREFWSLPMQLGPAVLDPRPDSETLIAGVLERIGDPGFRGPIADLGTGSGCLLLALLSELPEATGIGVDVSPAAVVVARRNAAALGLQRRASFRQGCWGEGLARGFTLVVSNPPYIPTAEIAALEPEVARFEPRLALDGGPDGLDAYRALAAAVPPLLAPGGVAALEIGRNQAEPVERLMAERGLLPAGRKRDLGGMERCVFLRMPAET